jgi:hypothetical protein
MPTGPVAHRPLALGHVQSPVAQGWINDPGDCHWSPHEIVGFKAPCGTITPADATVMAKIWDGLVTVQGKKLWFGLERGASLAGLAGTTTSEAYIRFSVPVAAHCARRRSAWAL